MTFLLKRVGGHVLNQKLAERADEKGQEWIRRDLKHQENFIRDKKGKPTGRTKRVERGFPKGLTQQEQKLLKKVRWRAKLFDEAVSFLGVKAGVGALVGFLLPFVGDFVDVFLALLVFWKCTEIEGGLDKKTKAKMLRNIGMDWAIGLFPILGDIGDMFFRANARNYDLLEDELVKRVRARGGAPFPGEMTHQQMAGRAQINTEPYPSNLQTTNLGPTSRYETGAVGREYSYNTEPTRPEPAQLSNKTGSRGWFERLLNPQTEPDVELGERDGQSNGPRRFITGDDLRRAKEATAR